MTRRFAYCAVLLSIVLILMHAWFSSYDHDEIQHLHQAWLVSQGLSPYTDFLGQSHPTLWYLLSPVTNLFSSPHSIVLLARSFDILLMIVFGIAFFKICRLILKNSDAPLCVALLFSSFVFTRNMMEVRPDPWMAVFIYLGIYYWLVFLEQGKIRKALLAGVLFGLAYIFSQKSLAMSGLVLLSIPAIWLVKRKDNEGRTGLFMGGAALLCGIIIPAAPWLYLVFHKLNGREFVFWNYIFNRYLYLQQQPDIQNIHFSIFKTLSHAFILSPFLFILGAAGLALTIINIWRERDCNSSERKYYTTLVVLAIGYIVWLATSRFPFNQYLIVWLPLVAIFAMRIRRENLIKAAVVLNIIECVAVIAFYPSNSNIASIADEILAKTAITDTIYAPPPYHPIIRFDSAYFWYNGEMIGSAYANYCGANKCADNKLDLEDRRWNETPPKVVFINKEHPEQESYQWEKRQKGLPASTLQISDYHR